MACDLNDYCTLCCICTGHRKKKGKDAKDKVKKRSFLTCCLAPKTLDADWQEARDDVSITSQEDKVRNNTSKSCVIT